MIWNISSNNFNHLQLENSLKDDEELKSSISGKSFS